LPLTGLDAIVGGQTRCREGDAMPYISNIPTPPYDTVVFTSINADVDHTEHVEMFGRLV
jgi:hypothetical protein